jgi:TrmH family RNA methyltransferase
LAAEEIRMAYENGFFPDRRPVNALRHILNNTVGKQVADWDFIDGSGQFSIENRFYFPGVRIFLEDIRSPFNIGSIFRVAESFGVECILVSPLSAHPEHPRATRSAMGCDALVRWEQGRIEGLTGDIFALEKGGQDLKSFVFPLAGTMILGSEELGVSPSALAISEKSKGRLSIPTVGLKGSLNVGTAFAIAMHEWCAQLLIGNAYSRT